MNERVVCEAGVPGRTHRYNGVTGSLDTNHEYNTIQYNRTGLQHMYIHNFETGEASDIQSGIIDWRSLGLPPARSLWMMEPRGTGKLCCSLMKKGHAPRRPLRQAWGRDCT
jgi:hypothetical protein